MTTTTGTRRLWADTEAAFAALQVDPEGWAEHVRAESAWAAIVTPSRGDGAENMRGGRDQRSDPSRAGRS